MPADGTSRCLVHVSGEISRAKGLKATLFVSHPFVVVKGIKGNSHLVDFYKTQPASKASKADWFEDWSYDCLKERTRDEIVGLKFLVFDGEEFMGGADIDLSEMSAWKTHIEELELTGTVAKAVNGKVQRKGRLFVSLAVKREFLPGFERPEIMLRDSLNTVTRVLSICGRIVRAKGLTGVMGKRSLPMCYVRCQLMSGKIIDVADTMCSKNVAEPSWDETFEYDFEDENDKPLFIMFDIWGSAARSQASLNVRDCGDHLGTAVLAVADILNEEAFSQGQSRFRLPLICDTGLVERRLNANGTHFDPKAWEKPCVKTAMTFSERQKVRDKGSDPFAGLVSMLGGILGKNATSGEKDTNELDISHPREITVELFTLREEKVPMPHLALLTEPEEMEPDTPGAQEDDELRALFQAGARRLQVSATERIMVVYGKVCAASDLVSVDILGRRNPYCLIEAINRTGTATFMHRTRAIKGSLCPVWNEPFVFVVPPDPDYPANPMYLQAVRFSVFDCRNEIHHDEKKSRRLVEGDHAADQHHQSAEVAKEEEDELLGRCVVNLGFMRTQDYFHEDVPLLGAPAKPGGFVSKGGFKRYSTISSEVRVERRVCRTVAVKTFENTGMLDVYRHNDSRPEMKLDPRDHFKDWGQEVAVCGPVASDVAKKVLDLRERNLLLERSRHNKEGKIAGWLKMPRLRKEQSLPSLRPPLIVQRSRPESKEAEIRGPCSPFDHRRSWLPALKDNWKDTLQQSRLVEFDLDHAATSPLAPRRRTGSLPALHTRFGDRFEQMMEDPFEPSTWEGAVALQKELVLPNFGDIADDTIRRFADKPTHNQVSNQPLKRKCLPPARAQSPLVLVL